MKKKPTYGALVTLKSKSLLHSKDIKSYLKNFKNTHGSLPPIKFDKRIKRFKFSYQTPPIEIDDVFKIHKNCRVNFFCSENFTP